MGEGYVPSQADSCCGETRATAAHLRDKEALQDREQQQDSNFARLTSHVYNKGHNNEPYILRVVYLAV